MWGVWIFAQERLKKERLFNGSEGISGSFCCNYSNELGDLLFLRVELRKLRERYHHVTGVPFEKFWEILPRATSRTKGYDRYANGLSQRAGRMRFGDQNRILPHREVRLPV
jgi:hypothetical protein